MFKILHDRELKIIYMIGPGETNTGEASTEKGLVCAVFWDIPQPPQIRLTLMFSKVYHISTVSLALWTRFQALLTSEELLRAGEAVQLSSSGCGTLVKGADDPIAIRLDFLLIIELGSSIPIVGLHILEGRSVCWIGFMQP